MAATRSSSWRTRFLSRCPERPRGRRARPETADASATTGLDDEVATEVQALESGLPRRAETDELERSTQQPAVEHAEDPAVAGRLDRADPEVGESAGQQHRPQLRQRRPVA